MNLAYDDVPGLTVGQIGLGVAIVLLVVMWFWIGGDDE